MSDGVWKYVPRDLLVQIALEKNGQGLIEALSNKARLRGSGAFQDDFTIVLIERDRESE